jgi:enoyl-CoA hydratase/carnithine racemase
VVVEYEQEDEIIVIRMNRPRSLNAVTVEMRHQLALAWRRFEDDPTARVAILTGADRAFTAGVDVKESVSDSGTMAMREPPIPIECLFWTNNDLTKPVIAAVNGYAMGVGFIMAVLTADLCIAAESATFEISEIARGLVSGWDWGWQQNWPRAICMELALGYRISAHRAYDAGLIVGVVPDDQLMDAARAKAKDLLRIPPAIVRAHRDLVRSMAPVVPQEVLDRATRYSESHKGSEDAQEAVRSWLERRPPVYTGR